MSDSLRHILDLPDEHWVRLERITGRFEEAWHEGSRPVIEDHLPDDPAGRWSALIEMIHIELEFRLQAGENARVEEYLGRFPELGYEDAVVQGLVAAELELRRAREPGAFQDCLSRFPRFARELLPLRESQLDGPVSSGLVPEAPDPVRIGKFELREVVGQGAFGIVYRAWDSEAGRDVALKILRPDRLASREAADRLLREARSAALLDHPNIVKVYEAGPSGMTCYLATELIRGSTLADRLARGGLPLGQTAEMVACVAEALQFAHRSGVVHRDLKPSNLLLDHEGKPHVADFGLAKGDATESTLTITGEILGTPAYMSPEQARGEAHQVDGRSDIYSLGVVLYELLTGVLPFRGSPRKLLQQVLNDDPPPPRLLNGLVPGDLETICLKAMAKKPSDRYQTAGAMADDLRRFLASKPIRARRAGPWRRAASWMRKHPARAALAALVLFATPTGVGGVLWQRRHSERDRQVLASRDQTEAASRERLEASRYVHLISLAQREVAADNLGRVEELLSECPATLRGWEWSYLKGLPRGAPREIRNHAGIVFDVAFGRHGRRLASAGGDQTVRLWDVATASELLTIRGHTGPVYGVCFRPDGRCLASAAGDRTVRVWDSESGSEIRVLHGHTGNVYSVAFSPGGRKLASAGGNGEVKIWDWASGREIHALSGHTDAVFGVTFRRGGRQVATAGGDGTVRIWSAETGRELRILRGHKDSVFGVAFSSDGKWLASAGGGGTVKVWDAETGTKALDLHGHAGVVFGVAFSPDGRRLASAGADRSVRLWDVGTGQEVLDLRGQTDIVWSVAFSLDGQHLASAGADGRLRLVDAAPPDDRFDPSLLTLRGHSNAVRSVAFSPDGSRLASAGGGRSVKVWDVETGKQVLTLRGNAGVVFGVAFSPDGSRLASGGSDGTVKIWDVSTGREVLVLKTSPLFTIASVVFSPNGKRLASAGGGGSVRVWDARTGRELLTIGDFTGVVSGVSYSPDSTRVAAAGGDGSVRVWDVETGRELGAPVGHCKQTFSIAFSPDGRYLASVGGDSTLMIWDFETRLGRSFPLGIGGHFVYAVAYSPDGARLATADARGTVVIWDAASGRQDRIIRGHAGRVLSIAFSPDGSRLASGGYDKLIKIWDVSPTATQALRLLPGRHTEGAPVQGRSFRLSGVPISPR